MKRFDVDTYIVGLAGRSAAKGLGLLVTLLLQPLAFGELLGILLGVGSIVLVVMLLIDVVDSITGRDEG